MVVGFSANAQLWGAICDPKKGDADCANQQFPDNVNLPYCRSAAGSSGGTTGFTCQSAETNFWKSGPGPKPGACLFDTSCPAPFFRYSKAPPFNGQCVTDIEQCFLKGAGGNGEGGVTSAPDREEEKEPCFPLESNKQNNGATGFAPGPGGQAPSWGSSCAMEINRQTKVQKRMFYDSCMQGGKCSRFNWQCRIDRQRFCIGWSNVYEKDPQPASCDLAKICQPPGGVSLDDWLNGTPQIGSGKPHLPFILRSICIQYFQVINSKNGKSAVGCTRNELDKELARYYPQCKRPNPKN